STMALWQGIDCIGACWQGLTVRVYVDVRKGVYMHGKWVYNSSGVAVYAKGATLLKQVQG
ncbi:hypothetical protein, partial [Pseudomonas sp. yb_9]|uniref:hypothetical protein n=1 Tax=Pseudomonas sp. yb_9 TaxID=3367222 RepID=UPI00370C09AD